jgi:hypothetical protein
MLDSMSESMTLAQKSVRLSLCGFSRGDVASILQIAPAGVSQNLYSERQKAAAATKKATAPVKKAVKRT